MPESPIPESERTESDTTRDTRRAVSEPNDVAAEKGSKGKDHPSQSTPPVFEYDPAHAGNSSQGGASGS